MSTSTYGIQAAYLRKGIDIGRLNKAREVFLEKHDATDMALAAVANYVQQNFDGGMEVDFPGLGVVMNVQVRPIGAPTEGDRA